VVPPNQRESRVHFQKKSGGSTKSVDTNKSDDKLNEQVASDRGYSESRNFSDRSFSERDGENKKSDTSRSSNNRGSTSGNGMSRDVLRMMRQVQQNGVDHVVNDSKSADLKTT